MAERWSDILPNGRVELVDGTQSFKDPVSLGATLAVVEWRLAYERKKEQASWSAKKENRKWDSYNKSEAETSGLPLSPVRVYSIDFFGLGSSQRIKGRVDRVEAQVVRGE
jgi:hypothetical protein